MEKRLQDVEMEKQILESNLNEELNQVRQSFLQVIKQHQIKMQVPGVNTGRNATIGNVQGASIKVPNNQSVQVNTNYGPRSDSYVGAVAGIH